jgi:hypothetical protein
VREEAIGESSPSQFTAGRIVVARDGSSKQRGHGGRPGDFPVAEEAIFRSGSAAFYRRAMLE